MMIETQVPEDGGSRKKEQLLLLLILSVAAFLRLMHLYDLSLSNDELSAISRARFPSLIEMYRAGAFLDGHPAGVQVFLFGWMKWFGDEPFVIRFPFVLFSLGSIYLIYRIGKDWFHATAGLLTAAFFAVMEFPLMYSIFARPYSPGLFFVLAAVFYWTRFTRSLSETSGYRQGDLTGLTLALLLGVHTHYFAVVSLVWMCMTGFFIVPKKSWPLYLLVCSFGAFSFLFELKFFWDLMKVGGLGDWLAKPDVTFPIQFILTVFNANALLAGVFFGLMTANGFIRLKHKQISKFHVFALSWVLLTFMLAYGYSVVIAPVLQASTLYFVLPFLMLVCFSFWPKVGTTVNGRAVSVLLLLLAGSFSTVVAKRFYDRPPYGVFKEVANSLSSWDRNYNRVPAVINVVNPEYIDYYFRRNEGAPHERYYKIESAGDLARLREILDTSTAAYFAYGWSNFSHPYQILEMIRQHYPVEVDSAFFFNSEARLFGRGAPCSPGRLVAGWNQPYEDTALSSGIVCKDSLAKSGNGYFRFKQDAEFSPGIEQQCPYSFRRFMVAHASVWFNCADTTGDQSLAIAFLRDNEFVRWENVPLKSYNLHPGQWQQAFYSVVVPQDVRGSMDLKVYVWNSSKKEFSIDDLSVKLIEEVDPYFRK